MKLQNQVCTMQQANMLKELGVIQNAAFYYDSFETLQASGILNRKQYYNAKEIAAFNVAELGLMLGIKCNNCFYVCAGIWVHNIVNRSNCYTSQAECYADYLIICIKDGRIKIDKINTLLND